MDDSWRIRVRHDFIGYYFVLLLCTALLIQLNPSLYIVRCGGCMLLIDGRGWLHSRKIRCKSKTRSKARCGAYKMTSGAGSPRVPGRCFGRCTGISPRFLCLCLYHWPDSRYPEPSSRCLSLPRCDRNFFQTAGKL